MGKHLSITGFLFAFVFGAVTVAAWVNPTSFRWFAAHGGWWWLAGLAVLFGLCWAALARYWSDPSMTTVGAPPAAPAPPTAHDQNLFSNVLKTFPLDEGTMGWLNVGFFGKDWRNKYVYPLIDFDAVYRDRYFDDDALASDFEAFKTACGKLLSWFIDEAGDEVPQADGDILHRIKTASARQSSHDEYVAAIRTGERLAREVFDARKKLERTGRLSRLVPPLN